MSRDRLVRAINAVGTAREATTDGETGDRLAQLESHLESQANRDTTPALGTLDRVQTKLHEIEDEASDPTVEGSLADARQHILSFLGTLDDRGMKQH